MSYRECEVLDYTTETVHHEGDQNGPASTVTTLTLRAKLPNEDMRPTGLYLYAMASFLFFPTFVDGLWYVYSGGLKGPIKMPPPPLTKTRSIYDPPESDGEDPPDPPDPNPRRTCAVKFAGDFLLFLIASPVIFGLGLPCVILFLGVVYPLDCVIRMFLILYDLVRREVPRLQYRPVYRTYDWLEVTKTRTDGEDVWLVTLKILLSDHDWFSRDRAVGFSSLKSGDTFHLGFGPFESSCLFRTWAPRGDSIQPSSDGLGQPV